MCLHLAGSPYVNLFTMQQIIAIQGGHASFHDIAAREYFDNDIDIVQCNLPFVNVFDALDSGAGAAVCAIENSLYGSINEVYDLLIKTDVTIVGEIYLRIEQALIGLPDASIDKITEVHSHPVALAQCEAFLDSSLQHATRFEHNDTALSVKDIKDWNDPTKVAIASKQAAKLYELKVLKDSIETNHENYTRFVVLKKGNINLPKNATKSSLVLTTHGDTKPGALHRTLGAFAKRNLNLTLLHSRPLIGLAWHYMFYVDVIGGVENDQLGEAIKELNDSGCEIKHLGSYIPGKVL